MTTVTSVSADTRGSTGAAEETRKPRRRQRNLDPLMILVWQIVVMAALLLVWQIAVWLELYKPIVLSSPEAVWLSLRELLSSGTIVENLWITIRAALISLLLAVLVGVPFGLMLALLPRTERVLSPILNGLNASPRIAFAPVFIIIFGLSESAKVALAFSIGVFILISNTRAGVHNADHDVLTLMRAMGAKKRDVFLKVLMPAAAPSIFAGMRLGLIFCMLGVVGSELIAAEAGIGQLIAQYSASFRLSEVYAIILVLVVVAALLNGLLEHVERRLTRWRPPAQSSKGEN